VVVLAGLFWFVFVPNWRPPLRDGERYGVDVSVHQGEIDWRRSPPTTFSTSPSASCSMRPAADDRIETAHSLVDLSDSAARRGHENGLLRLDPFMLIGLDE
jgi:hypothetical protein